MTEKFPKDGEFESKEDSNKEASEQEQPYDYIREEIEMMRRGGFSEEKINEFQEHEEKEQRRRENRLGKIVGGLGDVFKNDLPDEVDKLFSNQ